MSACDAHKHSVPEYVACMYGAETSGILFHKLVENVDQACKTQITTRSMEGGGEMICASQCKAMCEKMGPRNGESHLSELASRQMSHDVQVSSALRFPFFFPFYIKTK